MTKPAPPSSRLPADAGAPRACPWASSPRRSSLLTWPVLAWGLWDWGSAAFNAVITTFVFTVYLTSEAFGPEASTQSALSTGLAVAGVCIALLAPVTGQRADRAGRTVFWLAAYTAVVVAVSAAMFLVLPRPGYLWLGIVLLGVGNVFFELATVNYNGMLGHLATRDRIGAVSGLGWGMGYIGGIVLLLIVYVGFIQPQVGWFGVTGEDGLDVRVSVLLSALWFGVFALPVVVTQSGRGARRRRARVAVANQEEASRGQERQAATMETGPDDQQEQVPRRRESLVASYVGLWRTLARLRHDHPEVLWFLLASAVFRDGLAGVFTYGGVIAQATFGFSAGDVVVFAVAANLVAGVTTIAAGRLDDAVGARRVILGSLAVLVVAGVLVFVLHDAGAGVFWALGLVLSGCVGPAQSASRSFLARLIPPGREGEVFGLYATTGRAVSFLAPMMYGAFLGVGASVEGASATHWGVLGVVAVVLAGLLLMLRVRDTDGQVALGGAGA
ncbi:MFS transporter [Actinomyces sp. 2119]|uniref:MFS transporter n=1 Tax=Actinomyces lilanjuaniae TaxID=2321394 RepID=A0ABM6Z562_9ACTO|nr:MULTISPECIES: MFS transporter [Actinomyces]AYD90531.1 MFS transporter [Actinomyces lilanjuaniae]RJF44017.1 MFS transporter [Actinomyces sp. 2119]